MGIDDRDYMREVPIYRELVHGNPRVPATEPQPATRPPSWTPPPPPIVRRRVRTRQTRPWGWFGLGAVTVLGLLSLVVSHHQAPSSPLGRVAPVAAPPPPETISGPRQATVGSILTLRGSVEPGFDGPVSVVGRWDGGAWIALASTMATNGQYEVRLPLDQRGVVDLRVSLPDGQLATSTITVD